MGILWQVPQDVVENPCHAEFADHVDYNVYTCDFGHSTRGRRVCVRIRGEQDDELLIVSLTDYCVAIFVGTLHNLYRNGWYSVASTLRQNGFDKYFCLYLPKSPSLCRNLLLNCLRRIDLLDNVST